MVSPIRFRRARSDIERHVLYASASSDDKLKSLGMAVPTSQLLRDQYSADRAANKDFGGRDDSADHFKTQTFERESQLSAESNPYEHCMEKST